MVSSRSVNEPLQLIYLPRCLSYLACHKRFSLLDFSLKQFCRSVCKKSSSIDASNLIRCKNALLIWEIVLKISSLAHLRNDPWKSWWNESLTKYGTLRFCVTLRFGYLLFCCRLYSGSETNSVENRDRNRMSRIGISWTSAV